MRKRPEDLLEKVADRESLALFLDALSEDAAERGSEWENAHILDMLESMAAWLRDSSEQQTTLESERNAWQLVARVLLAGKHYE
jgi:hypothetical protein